jgi:hypothetical protein
LLAPPIALASNIEEELEQMRERIAELEAKVAAEKTGEEAEGREEPSASSEPIATPVATDEGADEEDRSAMSALSSFLESTEFSGWVAVSYNYNFNGSSNTKKEGRNSGFFAGRDAGLFPFHSDSNTFAVDQIWFEIDKPASEDSRGGFHVDLLFGETAESLGGGAHSGSFDQDPFAGQAFDDVNSGNIVQLEDLVIENRNGSGDLVKVYSAYVSYLAPLGTGVEINAGKLPTLLGAEVAQSPYNFNITRGLVYGLQPITHLGVIVSTELSPGVSASLGATNGVFSDTNTDLDDNKALTGQLAYSSDLFSVATSVIWGSPMSSREGDRVGVLDVVLTADPADSLSLWVNFDYQWFRGDGEELDGNNYGIAVAGRYAVSDRAGFSARGEWVRYDPHENMFASIPTTGDTERDLFSATATLDYALTNHLQFRLEARHDWIHSTLVIVGIPVKEAYWKGNGGATDHQTVALAELMYSF